MTVLRAALPSRLADVPAVARSHRVLLVVLLSAVPLGWAAGAPQPGNPPKIGAPQPAAATDLRGDALGDALPPAALMRMGTVRFRHPNNANGLAMAADGATVATHGS